MNELSLNIDKCSFVAFGSYFYSVPSVLDIMIDCQFLERMNFCKYFGIIVYFRLKWEEHIDNLIKRTKYLVLVFYKLKKLLNIVHLKMIYHALFSSIINLITALRYMEVYMQLT